MTSVALGFISECRFNKFSCSGVRISLYLSSETVVYEGERVDDEGMRVCVFVCVDVGGGGGVEGRVISLLESSVAPSYE